MKTSITMTKEELESKIIEPLRRNNPILVDKPDEAFNIYVRTKMGKTIEFKGLIIEIDLDMKKDQADVIEH